MSADALGLVSSIASGGVAHFLDTSTSYTAGNLFEWRNNGVVKASIDYAGVLTATTLSATSSITLTVPSNTHAVATVNTTTASYSSSIKFGRAGVVKALFGVQGSNAAQLVTTGGTAYAGVINVIDGVSLQFGTTDTVRLAINAAGNVGIAETAKFYFDGVAATGDTYRYEKSANVLVDVVGGVEGLTLAYVSAGVASAAIAGPLTTNGGLQTFGANDSGGAGFRQVLVPNA